MLKMACMSILSGLYIPLEFYPEWLLKLTYVFPFRAIYYLPVSAMMKSYSLEEGLLLILQQLAWVTVLLVLCISLQRAAFKKLTVQGDRGWIDLRNICAATGLISRPTCLYMQNIRRISLRLMLPVP